MTGWFLDVLTWDEHAIMFPPMRTGQRMVWSTRSTHHHSCSASEGWDMGHGDEIAGLGEIRPLNVWAKKANLIDVTVKFYLQSQLKKLEFIIFSWMSQMKRLTRIIPCSMTSLPRIWRGNGGNDGYFSGSGAKAATFGRRLRKYACSLATSRCCSNGAAERTVSSHANKCHSSSIPNPWHGGDSSEIWVVFLGKDEISESIKEIYRCSSVRYWTLTWLFLYVTLVCAKFPTVPGCMAKWNDSSDVAEVSVSRMSPGELGIQVDEEQRVPERGEKLGKTWTELHTVWHSVAVR